MLEHLFVKNFALVEDLTIDFSDNFNVLTGETGAGKSIIIDALALLLGGRAQTEFIRSGTEKAVLEGTFFIPNSPFVWELLHEMGIEDEDSTLVLSREISLNGRNVCRLNGRVFTLGQYQQLGLALVDLHGQHAHQTLLQGDKHLDLLDKFGGLAHQQLKQEVKEKYERYLVIKKELEELRASEKERLQKIDYLNFQSEEIKQAKIKLGELEELTKEVQILVHAEKISENLYLAYQQLFGEEKGVAAYDLLSKALDNLHELKELDSSLKNLAAQLEPALYLIEETALQIREYREEIDYSPTRLEQSENRLHFLKDLCKKYGPSIEDVLLHAQKVETELQKWHSSSERLEQLQGEVKKYLEEYETTAKTLSQKRKKLAETLEIKVIAQLVELAMPDIRFAIKFLSSEPSAQGLEQVEFLISPNPGEPLLPVAKIASGGELSRIMLALKTIMAETDGIGTLVFDEIDAGIGGKAVQKVAEKLERISKSQQVICVTHSPLVAAIADRHLLLEKKVEKGRTRTIIQLLDEEERVEELARMLGGENPSADLKKHASKILKRK
ncbi:MAG: DNA repair protein RecN [Clostridia bacterium]|nr:DNA repair protein RecN [Clostridia bacterium]MDD4664936.1 DNA repair protein RecN [Clostridia bacterium]